VLGTDRGSVSPICEKIADNPASSTSPRPDRGTFKTFLKCLILFVLLLPLMTDQGATAQMGPVLVVNKETRQCGYHYPGDPHQQYKLPEIWKPHHAIGYVEIRTPYGKCIIHKNEDAYKDCCTQLNFKVIAFEDVPNIPARKKMHWQGDPNIQPEGNYACALENQHLTTFFSAGITLNPVRKECTGYMEFHAGNIQVEPHQCLKDENWISYRVQYKAPKGFDYRYFRKYETPYGVCEMRDGSDDWGDCCRQLKLDYAGQIEGEKLPSHWKPGDPE